MIQVKRLTNIIEAIVFASGDAVPVKFIVEKLGCTLNEVNSCVDELKEKYSGDCGIHVLVFNGKLQFATNPEYKEPVQDVITPIKEKEFTRAILECAAIVAYKQPITRSELEDIRQVSCDYAIHTLLDLDMIYACGRKDTIGKPILYATTDNFLKRFKLNSIEELPDYDELMAQIAELNTIPEPDDDSNYLYKKDEYNPDEDEEVINARKLAEAEAEANAENDEEDEEEKYYKQMSEKKKNIDEDGFEIPDFLDDDDEVIEIKDDDEIIEIE